MSHHETQPVAKQESGTFLQSLHNTAETRTGRVAAGSAITLAAALALSACAPSEAAPKPTPTVAETGRVYERVTDPATCVEHNNDRSIMPPNVVECDLFEKLSPKQQQIILEAEQAPENKFFSLPIENQQIFQNFVLENNAWRGAFKANDALKFDGLEDYAIKEYQPNYRTDDETNTIQSNEQINTALAVYNSLATKDAVTGEVVYDKETARKILPMIAMPNSPAYEELLRGINTAVHVPFETATEQGINGGNPYIFTGINNIEVGKEVTTRDGVKAVEKTADSEQAVESTPASGWVLPYGKVKIKYSQVNTATIDGKGTTNLILRDIVADQS